MTVNANATELTANAVQYYPADQKPCRNYEELMDACLADFGHGEGAIETPYIDKDGHLTIGIGTLLYNKRNGEAGLAVNGQSRFDMCGFTPEQRDAAIKATQLLNPRECNRLSKNEVRTITAREGNDEYHIQVQRIPDAGTRVLSVQKNDEPPIMMPHINDDQYRRCFQETFRNYYDTAKQGCPQLHNLPRDLQLGVMHQVYARGNSGWVASARTLQEVQQCYNDSIQRRQVTVGVSDAELQQQARIARSMTAISNNISSGRVVSADAARLAQNGDIFDNAVNQKATQERDNVFIAQANSAKNQACSGYYLLRNQPLRETEEKTQSGGNEASGGSAPTKSANRNNVSRSQKQSENPWSREAITDFRGGR